MAKTIEEVMTKNPKMLSSDATVVEAARAMDTQNIGNVLVADEHGELCGIVTDRDLVCRVVAAGKDPAKTKVGEICSKKVVFLHPSASVGDAVRLMTENAIRRIPVLKNGSSMVIGMVSLGDLARAQDPKSALGSISAARPQH